MSRCRAGSFAVIGVCITLTCASSLWLVATDAEVPQLIPVVPSPMKHWSIPQRPGRSSKSQKEYADALLARLRAGYLDAVSDASVQLGAMGPPCTKRASLHYYDTLFLLARMYAPNGGSVLEVGCGADPFSGLLTWFDTQRVCVAPYFAPYHQRSCNQSATTTRPTAAVQQVTADFMKWNSSQKFDLVICSQVVEHVEHPASFVKKMLEYGRTVKYICHRFLWFHKHDSIPTIPRPQSPGYNFRSVQVGQLRPDL